MASRPIPPCLYLRKLSVQMNASGSLWAMRVKDIGKIEKCLLSILSEFPKAFSSLWACQGKKSHTSSHFDDVTTWRGSRNGGANEIALSLAVFMVCSGPFITSRIYPTHNFPFFIRLSALASIPWLRPWQIESGFLTIIPSSYKANTKPPEAPTDTGSVWMAYTDFRFLWHHQILLLYILMTLLSDLT